MQRSIRNFWHDTEGQDLVEYALAAGMVAVAAVGSVPQLSTVMSNVFIAISGIVQNSVQLAWQPAG
jgi:pilus assembly protein Flp/PilA